MAKREYSFYPGCSSQKGASSSNYMVSVQTMCEELDIQLNEIPDWNCCSASIGYAGGGELPRLALSARNIALSEEHHPGQDIVATCAACWLSTREAAERLEVLGYTNIHARLGDGYHGWPEQAPFDAILVTAAAREVPGPLIDQLRPGGKLVIPVGHPDFGQELLLLQKAEDGSVSRYEILPVAFVPLTGKH